MRRTLVGGRAGAIVTNRAGRARGPGASRTVVAHGGECEGTRDCASSHMSSQQTTMRMQCYYNKGDTNAYMITRNGTRNHAPHTDIRRYTTTERMSRDGAQDATYPCRQPHQRSCYQQGRSRSRPRCQPDSSCPREQMRGYTRLRVVPRVESADNCYNENAILRQQRGHKRLHTTTTTRSTHSAKLPS